jgi:6-pyruvoyltetrahydropterin/6-carboxytetrahydropterin synthase
MYELTIAGDFSSAHFLKGYKGSCQNLHGHTWKVAVTVTAEATDEVGLVLDFKEMKKKLKVTLDSLDHKCLNDLPVFQKENPSTENLARYLYRAFAKECLPLKMKKVQVWESDSASVVYYE